MLNIKSRSESTEITEAFLRVLREYNFAPSSVSKPVFIIYIKRNKIETLSFEDNGQNPAKHKV